MKHLLLYSGIGVIAYMMYQKHQTAIASTTNVSTIASMPVGTIAGAGTDDACNTCDTIKGLGTDAAGNTIAAQQGPDAVTHSIERSDYDSANPFLLSAM